MNAKITLHYEIEWIDRAYSPARLVTAEYKTTVNLNSRSLSTAYNRLIKSCAAARIPVLDIVDVRLVNRHEN